MRTAAQALAATATSRGMPFGHCAPLVSASRTKRNIHLRAFPGREHVRCLSLSSIGDRVHRSPGDADIDWDELSFDYLRTDYHLEYTWRDGEWDKGEIVSEQYVKLHVMSGCLHYGQQLFEGLKAHVCTDGAVRIFQPDNANALRLQGGCRRLCMPEVPTDMFNAAICDAVRANIGYVPPLGKGSLYIRPFMIGCGPQLGLSPAPEYKFLVQVMPVGCYYGDGFEGLDALIMEDFDRVAPKGTGNVKCGGNYGADLLPSSKTMDEGYSTCLYTDAETNSFVEEFSVSNFIAISQSGAFVTPDSSTVLNSVTNRALQQIALDKGLVVERRPIPVSELPELQEVAAVGTAVVLNPIRSITLGDDRIMYRPPKKLSSLKSELVDIQVGNLPDRHNWNQTV